MRRLLAALACLGALTVVALLASTLEFGAGPRTHAPRVTEEASDQPARLTGARGHESPSLTTTGSPPDASLSGGHAGGGLLLKILADVPGTSIGIGNATVSATLEDGTLVEASTDREGRAHIACREEEWRQVQVTAVGYLPVKEHSHRHVGATEVVLRMPPAVPPIEWVGRVEDAEGRPVPGALVYEEVHDVRSRAGPDGWFKVTVVPWVDPAGMELAAWSPGHAVTRVDAPDHSASVGVIRLRGADAPLEFTIQATDERERGVPCCRLLVLGMSADAGPAVDIEELTSAWEGRATWRWFRKTDEQGRPVTLQLLRGEYRVHAATDRLCGSLEIRVSDPGQLVTLPMHRGSVLNLRLSGLTGIPSLTQPDPVPVLVSLTEATGLHTHEWEFLHDGTVIAQGLPRSTLKLHVHTGDGLVWSSPVDLDSGTTWSEVPLVVRVPPCLSLRGEVTHSGVLLAGAGMLRFRNPAGWVTHVALEDGAFRAGAVPMDSNAIEVVMAAQGGGRFKGSVTPGDLRNGTTLTVE